MERFAIKIDRPLKSRLKSLCRLCGIDNPDQIEVLKSENYFDETALSVKIVECVGIQVARNDRMPQRICTLCADKINDFFEFREMCAATNVQTRKLLNLPDQVKVVPVKQQPAVESIFGIDGIDIKPEAEPARGKKAKKTATVTSVGAKAAPPAKNARAPKHAANESLACTAEDMDSGGLLTVLATARDARGKVAKAKGGKKEQAAALLAPKPLNQRERKREIQQKKDDRKRKADPKTAAKKVPAKRVKKEQDAAALIDCTICSKQFSSTAMYNDHLIHCGGPSPPKAAGKKKQAVAAAATKAAKAAKPTARRKIKSEPNIEITDTIVDDGGFMDTHFGDDDSDNEVSIPSALPLVHLPPKIEPAASKKPDNGKPKAKPRRAKAAAAVTAPEFNVTVNDKPELSDCRVMLEQLDLSLYAHMLNRDTSHAAAAIVVVEPMPLPPPPPPSPPPAMDQHIEVVRPSTSTSTVPPLTLRIKKEILSPEYGDGFDSELATNIKQERCDEVWELAGPSSAPAHKKKSKKQPKPHKLYKKPALLMMKIKQERIDYDESDAYPANQPHAAVPQLVDASARRTLDSSLPIITQIHSNIVPAAKPSKSAAATSMVINPIRLAQGLGMHATLPPMVRIKSEPIDQPDDGTDAMPDPDYMPMDSAFDDMANSAGPTVSTVDATNVGTFPTIASVESNVQCLIGHIKQERIDPPDVEHDMDGEQTELPELALPLTYQPHGMDNLPLTGDGLADCGDGGDGGAGDEGDVGNVGDVDGATLNAAHGVAANTNCENEAAMNDAESVPLPAETAESRDQSEFAVDAGDIIDGPIKAIEQSDTAKCVESGHVSAVVNNGTAAIDTGDGIQSGESMDLSESAALKSPAKSMDGQANDGVDMADEDGDAVIKSPENTPGTADESAGEASRDEQRPDGDATNEGAAPAPTTDTLLEFTESDHEQENEAAEINEPVNCAPIYTGGKENHDGKLIDAGANVSDNNNDDDGVHGKTVENSLKAPECDGRIEGGMPHHGTDNGQTPLNQMENDPATSMHIVDNLLTIEPSHEFDINSMVTNSEDNSILDTIDELVREVANEMISSDDSPPSEPQSSANESNAEPPSGENKGTNFMVPSFLDSIGTFEAAAEQTNKENSMGTLFNEQFGIDGGTAIGQKQSPMQELPSVEKAAEAAAAPIDAGSDADGKSAPPSSNGPTAADPGDFCTARSEHLIARDT